MTTKKPDRDRWTMIDLLTWMSVNEPRKGKALAKKLDWLEGCYEYEMSIGEADDDDY